MVLTHGHEDHISAGGLLSKKLGRPKNLYCKSHNASCPKIKPKERGGPEYGPFIDLENLYHWDFDVKFIKNDSFNSRYNTCTYKNTSWGNLPWKWFQIWSTSSLWIFSGFIMKLQRLVMMGHSVCCLIALVFGSWGLYSFRKAVGKHLKMKSAQQRNVCTTTFAEYLSCTSMCWSCIEI